MSRSSYWDAWKGISIIAVIAIHATGWSVSFPAGSGNYDFGIALRQFINFPVAFFFFFAGLFAFGVPGGPAAAPRPMWRSLWRLALPYLIWTAVYVVWRLMTKGMGLREFVLNLFTGMHIEIGYFVIVMLQLVVISPLLKKMPDRVLIWSLLVSFAVSVGYIYLPNVISPGSRLAVFPYNSLPFLVWLPFYLLGLLAGRPAGIRLREVPPIWPGLGAVAFTILALLEAFISPLQLPSPGSQLKATSMLASACVSLTVLAWQARSGGTGSAVMAWIGRRSFYFYLAHMLVLTYVAQVISRLGLRDMQVLFIPVATVATLGICTIGALMLDRMLASRPAGRRALGLL